MKKICFILLVFFLFNGCNNLKVSRVNNAVALKKNYLIYTLPETMVRVNVTIRKTTFIHGPFAGYAEKYLSITETIQEKKIRWEVADVQLETYPVAVAGEQYAIRFGCKNSLKNIQLTKNGFLVAINKKIEYSEPETKPISEIIPENEPDFTFTDLSVKKNIEEKKKGSHKRIKKDSVYIDVPLETTEAVVKTVEMKAEEAAQYIIKQRKRKFKLMSGIYEKFPEGATFDSMIRELDYLEKEYTALFTGKTITKDYFYTFDYLPVRSEKEPPVLFRFSESKGIVDHDGNEGYPVFLEVIPSGSTDSLNCYFVRQDSLKTWERGIVCRMPEQVCVKLKKENDILAIRNLIIAQFGSLVIIPSGLLKMRKIEFYPEYGSLKSVEQE